MSAAFAYLHMLSMIALGSLLFAQLLTFDFLHQEQGLRRFWNLSCGVAVAAAITLTIGIALLVWTDQGAAFYLHNPVFYIKLAIFTAMLLIAITPARIIIHWHRDSRVGEAFSGALPAAAMVSLLRRYLTVELILLIVIPLAASLAARGIGTQLSAS
jgi:putative membrane protein